MSQPPKTRSFAAWINLMPGSQPTLIVAGEVETSASNNKPVLKRSSGDAPAGTLQLDLTIRNTGGIGTQAFQFWPVRYDQAASRGAFSDVVILWDGEEIMTLPVSEVQ
ncbi:hypothetical protein QTO30_07795 [Yoonia sp. GPGPB17]|uniref:hypothetical protein n=1 Tax=Yoonia sp. GPGPB17 TaxID=3026147 RepID=UPI0030BE9277